jgi:DNA-directed RNA polymerase specialized sigma24 family protein
MNKARIEFFAKLSTEQKLQLSHKDFTVSEIEEIIAETPLNAMWREIAKLRYVHQCTIEEIANKLYIDYKTCQRSLKGISAKLKHTCDKMFLV